MYKENLWWLLFAYSSTLMKVALDENYIGSIATLVNYLNKSAKQIIHQLTLYHSWGI